jgi:alpha-mannosidase
VTAQHTLHVISHTHWDREWYLPFQQFRMRLVRVVDELLAIFESQERAAAGQGERGRAAGDGEFRAFHLDGQAVVLEDYLEVRPENAGRLRRQVAAGRILVGPWYVLPDEFLISGESHVRNLVVGQQVVARFGPSMRLGYLPDLFGHISQMPQLLVDAGFDTTVLWRGLSGEREGLKSELWWEAPDGSRVLCIHLPEQSGYSNANHLPADPDAACERVKGLRAERAPHALTEHLLLMNGTDHHGPQRELPALLRALNERLAPEGAQLVHTTLPEYVAAVRGTLDLDRSLEAAPERRDGLRGASGVVAVAPGEGGVQAVQAWTAVDERTGLQVRRGELRDVNRSGVLYSNFLLYGVASARTYLKQANHRAQRALERYAEPWSAVAWLQGAPTPRGCSSAPGSTCSRTIRTTASAAAASTRSTSR